MRSLKSIGMLLAPIILGSLTTTTQIHYNESPSAISYVRVHSIQPNWSDKHTTTIKYCDVSYRFKAWNRTFMLDLEPANNLVHPDFHVFKIQEGHTNSSLQIQAPSKLQHCLCHGKIRGDVHSLVSVSNCRGLIGLIHTKLTDYRIEPLRLGDSAIIHKLHIIQYRNKSDYHSNNSSLLMSRPLQRAKRSVSREWNMEMLLVADSKMKRYHGDNLEMYLLTLMASVALIFKDPSIGNNINISVAKLMIMEETQDTGIIFPSASKTLRNFCRWQEQQFDPRNPHDTAILLTREDLCRQSKTCDTLGLAQSGMICDRHSSCAVVEDNGLSAAFTIAHELGHILGIPHDDDMKCSRFQEQNQRFHIMARMLDYHSHPWSWSECSRHYVTSFLDAGYGNCLLNKSAKDKLTRFPYASMFPGQLYDMDYQCELVFGQGSKICPYMPVCKRLWCTMDDVSQGGCRTQHMPWADGTKCAPDKSCYHGECVLDPSTVVPPVDGQWGKWQEYGPCSRSCGGGIMRSIRECDNPRPTNGGQYCVGHRVRYQSCASENCLPGSIDFREEQCSAFDEKTFGFIGINENVKWIPHHSGIASRDTCKLYCRASGTAAYFLLKEKVIDGTTCGPDTFDICVNGKCMPAGCDHVLHSSKQPDTCGVCGGNGSTCRIIHGNYVKAQYGYNDVVMIPAGASNIEILQFGHDNTKDDNYLALMDFNNTYILNGDFMISMFPKTLHYAGSTLEYTGSDTIVEKISGIKQLQKNLYVQVLTVGSLHPPSVTFNYTISMADQVFYHWRLEENWSPCNSICQGEQYRKAVCIREDDALIVSDGHCREKERPLHSARVCNTDCVLNWEKKQVTTCSSTCGSGIILNTVKCFQHTNSGKKIEVPDPVCAHLSSRPDKFDACSGACNSTEWKFGEWSECSVTCGGGMQFRDAICIGDKTVKLQNSACQNISKITERRCALANCPDWKVADWSKCSVTCGLGLMKRQVNCYSADEKIVSTHFCDAIPKPEDEKICEELMCPIDIHHLFPTKHLENQLSQLPASSDDRVFQPVAPITSIWRAGIWSPCSRSCNEGIQTRSIICVLSNNKSVEDKFCNPQDKPSDKKICSGVKCLYPLSSFQPNSKIMHNNVENIFIWRTGSWGKCSKPCGGGIRRRQVACYDENNDNSTLCDPQKKPTDITTCNVEKCPHWKIDPWSKCSVTCGLGVQTRSVACITYKNHIVPNGRCSLPVPLKERKCRSSCLHWTWTPWSQCSVNCGRGIRKRIVKCHREKKAVKDDYCKNIFKPENQSRKCQGHHCRFKWQKKGWSECSASCGIGHKFRLVYCINDRGASAPDAFCNLHDKPRIKRRCHQHNCSFAWKTEHWSECSASCGIGIRRRIVTCHRVNAFQMMDPQPLKQSDDQLSIWCDENQKPSVIRNCSLGSCNGPIWRPGPWMPCSVKCGIGHQKRKVRCFNMEHKRIANKKCQKKLRPQRRRKCNMKSCSLLSCLDYQKKNSITADGEQEIFIHGKYINIYCSGMNTSSPKEYITLPKGERDNYSEIYKKRLINPSMCPFRGSRYDSCACVSDESIGSGLTLFHRIALNITSFQVLTHDFTYSITHTGHPVAFGESGDCYSMASCPQGRFSLSLLGTGFMVSSKTKWINQGNFASNKIQWLESGQVIQGKCGGYCGKCVPHPSTGLLLEIVPP